MNWTLHLILQESFRVQFKLKQNLKAPLYTPKSLNAHQKLVNKLNKSNVFGEIIGVSHSNGLNFESSVEFTLKKQKLLVH
jgi:hypothetical protein